jgi:chemotaxis protein methyltransferase CheR
MPRVKNNNPHIKPLEQALATKFGWQTGAMWRDKLLSAIERKAARLGLDELSYCRMAMHSAGELEVLADLICNSETRFFREPEQFEALRGRVLPELIKSRKAERRIDIWSAACSTGEEPYSLAILLSELLPEGEDWKATVFATDLRGAAIISASKGSYPTSALRVIDSAVRNRYFTGGQAQGRELMHEIAPAVKNLVSFRRANVYDQGFWKNINTRFDLITCNNLLLYFHALAARKTVERVAGVLRPGGMLMVMKNEGGYVNHPQLKRDLLLPGAFFRKV